jgi:DNA repair exonuclease SbcCD ATPase subunit
MAEAQVQKLKQELETLRQEFFQFQMRADAEKKSVEHKLAKAKQDISTIQVHSKSQSQRVQALQDSVQDKDHRLASLKKENLHKEQFVEEQQRVIAQQQRDIEALKNEKKELLSDVDAARATAACYKDDFERERSDRAKAAGKIDSLERTAVESARSLADKFQNESSHLRGKLEQAWEDLKVKTAQIKNYKKQVDGLQADLKKSQQTVESLLKDQEEGNKRYQNEVERLKLELKEAKQRIKSLPEDEMVMVESVPLADSTDAADSVPKSSKIKFFGKRFSKTKEEQARAKAEEKDRMKAKKLEREKTMRESKRRRKVDIEKMDEAKLKEYLGDEINRLERDNMTLRNQMECLEATSKCLVEKLFQTEALVVKGTRTTSSATRNVYEQVPLSERRKRSKGQAGESKHRGSSKSSAKHPQPSYAKDLIAHEGVHERIQRRKSSTDANIESNLDSKGPRPFTSDPRLHSKNEDYVNLPPGSPKSRPKALSPVETPRSKKSPIPTPRSVSVDPSRRGGGGGGLAAPDPHQQSLSMPPMPVKREEEEEDISHGLEDDIHSRALEVLETGSDEPTYALTSIPFDPFLECLYCNRKFRYGEIQKYRKHVNNCTGSS